MDTRNTDSPKFHHADLEAAYQLGWRDRVAIEADVRSGAIEGDADEPIPLSGVDIEDRIAGG